MASSNRVEFLTVDGVTLRGDLYMPNSTTNYVPIVVMTQGVTLPTVNNIMETAILTFHS
jgi:predicted acyl esterase